MGMVPSQRLDSQLVFQAETVRFISAAPLRCAGDRGPKTRELTGFIDEKMFSPADRSRFFTPHGPEFRRPVYGDERRDRCDWNGNGGSTTSPSDGSEDDDGDEDDGEVEGLVCGDDANKSKSKNKHQSCFGSKDGTDLGQSVNVMRVSSTENHHQLGNFQSAITIAEPDGEMCNSEYLHTYDGSCHVQRDFAVDNGCGFSGRKDVPLSSESGESLRAILSDPVTGALMDDAMILHCGHSFGSAGLEYVLKMKACYTCSQPVSDDLVSPNLSLRSAVRAFRREEELQFYLSSKRRRETERFDQNKGAYGDSGPSRGIQFPFSVTDHVVIKGNKRTPQRFVGREAIVTTQCLNGWYVVKTLDNAESVKLQYRSLAKASDDPSSKSIPSKMTPNWL